MDIARQKHLLYVTVLCQSYSPCGKYLVAANNFGQIAVFSLASALSHDANDSACNPVFTFKGHEGAIYSLISTETFLLSAGSAGDINAWRWTDIQNKAPKIVWSLTLPNGSGSDDTEVNSMAIDQQDISSKNLFVGAGDNNVYVWDMESRSIISTFIGHKDYIHDVTLRQRGQECISASEDGSVRLWDTRVGGESIHIIEPFKEERCSRPELGKWLSCVAVDNNDDWMACGGGPRLSLWHLRSLSVTSVFETSSVSPNTVQFYQDTVISAGNEAFVNHWFVTGESKARVPCTPSMVYNVSINQHSDKYKTLCVGGSSSKIDVCTNFGYKAFHFSFTSQQTAAD